MLKLMNYDLTVTSTARNLNPPNSTVTTSTLSLQNNSDDIIYIGDSNQQSFRVEVGGTFSLDNLETELSGKTANFRTADIYVRGTSGNISILTVRE